MKNKILCLLLLLPSLPVLAGELVEKAEQDQIALVKSESPEMLAAFAQAKKTLDTFLATWRNHSEQQRAFSVKVGVQDHGFTEYFWIKPSSEHQGTFVGIINNQPNVVKNVSFNDEIKFTRDEIVDWMYVDGKKMVGNFTACALLKNEPAADQQAFKARFGLECNP